MQSDQEIASKFLNGDGFERGDPQPAKKTSLHKKMSGSKISIQHINIKNV